MPLAKASDLRRDIAELIRSPRRMKVSEAVKQYMRVPMAGANSKPWDDSLTPYVTEPMDCLNSRLYDAVVFVGPARTGKTIGLIDGWIVYCIVCDPSDMLLVQVSEEKAREHSKKRLDRTFRNSPEVAKRMSTRSNDNNVHDKIFRAGNYLKIGWPSINILSSSDYKFVALTDYDRWPLDVGGEGDGYSLASKRTTTFLSSGMTMVESSPGHEIKDAKWRQKTPHEAPPCDGIFKLYNQGDRRRWYWQCPHCDEWFQPIHEHFTGYDNAPDIKTASDNVVMACPHCAGIIRPEQKRKLNQGGRWLREGETIDKQGCVTGHANPSRIASFWMEGPAAGFQTWSSLIYKLLHAEAEYEATGSQDSLKTVINTDLGRPYLHRHEGNVRDSQELMARAEGSGKRLVPEGVHFLVAGVDVQAGKNRRFVVQVVGYGIKGERWLIDRYNIKYSTVRADQDTGEAPQIDPAAYPEDWDMLITDVMQKSYPLETDDNRRMPILQTACDHGGAAGVSDNAYKFYRKLKRKRLAKKFMLVKGASGKQAKVINKSFPDNSNRVDRKASAKGDVPLYLLATNTLKDRIDSALSRSEVGANYIHLPNWLGEWFYDELTAEVRGLNGVWDKPNKKTPNEAFDLFCYCDAIVLKLGYEQINWDKPPLWAMPQAANANIISGDVVPVLVKPELTKPTSESVSKPDTKEQPKPVNSWFTNSNKTKGGWL
ncbi:phage terminase large subunit family protein [Motilimonas cestriensis]|uniref:phage terminase large subunit family protein n=1 Tax=Motilimonas cestriensis TaxID=2742685 RepID=UPI003DA5CC44